MWIYNGQVPVIFLKTTKKKKCVFNNTANFSRSTFHSNEEIDSLHDILCTTSFEKVNRDYCIGKYLLIQYMTTSSCTDYNACFMPN